MSLAGNQIKIIEKINHLNKLSFLDLSNNLIENAEGKDFPKNIEYLSLLCNPLDLQVKYLLVKTTNFKGNKNRKRYYFMLRRFKRVKWHHHYS